MNKSVDTSIELNKPSEEPLLNEVNDQIKLPPLEIIPELLNYSVSHIKFPIKTIPKNYLTNKEIKQINKLIDNKHTKEKLETNIKHVYESEKLSISMQQNNQILLEAIDNLKESTLNKIDNMKLLQNKQSDFKKIDKNKALRSKKYRTTAIQTDSLNKINKNKLEDKTQLTDIDEFSTKNVIKFDKKVQKSIESSLERIPLSNKIHNNVRRVLYINIQPKNNYNFQQNINTENTVQKPVSTDLTSSNDKNISIYEPLCIVGNQEPLWSMDNVPYLTTRNLNNTLATTYSEPMKVSLKDSIVSNLIHNCITSELKKEKSEDVHIVTNKNSVNIEPILQDTIKQFIENSSNTYPLHCSIQSNELKTDTKLKSEIDMNKIAMETIISNLDIGSKANKPIVPDLSMILDRTGVHASQINDNAHYIKDDYNIKPMDDCSVMNTGGKITKLSSDDKIIKEYSNYISESILINQNIVFIQIEVNARNLINNTWEAGLSLFIVTAQSLLESLHSKQNKLTSQLDQCIATINLQEHAIDVSIQTSNLQVNKSILVQDIEPVLNNTSNQSHWLFNINLQHLYDINQYISIELQQRNLIINKELSDYIAIFISFKNNSVYINKCNCINANRNASVNNLKLAHSQKSSIFVSNNNINAGCSESDCQIESIQDITDDTNLNFSNRNHIVSNITTHWPNKLFRSPLNKAWNGSCNTNELIETMPDSHKSEVSSYSNALNSTMNKHKGSNYTLSSEENGLYDLTNKSQLHRSLNDYIFSKYDYYPSQKDDQSTSYTSILNSQEIREFVSRFPILQNSIANTQTSVFTSEPKSNSLSQYDTSKSSGTTYYSTCLP